MTNKMIVTWDQILGMLRIIDRHNIKVYGVPKGGMILAGFLKNAINTHNIDEADVILDDIIDSGATMKYYKMKYPDKEFIGLIDKSHEPYKGKWIILPWEAEHPGNTEDDSAGIKHNILRVLEFIGEDVNSHDIDNYVESIVEGWSKLFDGYAYDINTNEPDKKMIQFPVRANTNQQIDESLIINDIPFISTCRCHMLPMWGSLYIAIPRRYDNIANDIIQFSKKICRRMYSIQSFTEDISKYIMARYKIIDIAVSSKLSPFCYFLYTDDVIYQRSDHVQTSIYVSGIYKEKIEAKTTSFILSNFII